MSLSVGGLISGLDTNDIIDQLKSIQQKPILKLQRQEADYQVQLSAYGNLQSALSGLKSAMENLDSASDLTSFSASSSDPDLFTVSADDTAIPGSYSITVTQMAEVHKLTSGGFSDGELVGKGIIQLKVGDGGTTDIAVSATNTINDVAQSINDAKAGVKATVIFDGTNYFLTLSGEDTGSANKISLTVTDDDGLNKDDSNLSRLFYEDLDPDNRMVQAQAAADSIITVDGVAGIHRNSNTIDNVIEGVTITLESPPDTDNQADLTVSGNTSEIVSKINSFVGAYNDVLDFFDSAQSYNAESETAGVLLGDAITNNIHSRLDRLVTGTGPSVESFSRLSDFGITLNSEGRLEVDSSTINSALDDDFDDVVEFFTQTTEGSEGFAVRMVDTLDAILDSTGGTLDARTDGIQNSIEDIQDQVERIEMRNLAWETRTRAQFNALELLLAGYQNTGNYLSQQILGMQNLNNYISNRG
ncbi:MAG: flagellar filament capping protein FliD [Thermodesulfobacteriota bacterium]|nr:flagellar filament capping protein FliD [Thermodesulfobacteriota bacterium]